MDPASHRPLDARALLPLALGLYAAYQDEITYASYDRLKQRFRAGLARDPIDSLLAISLIGAALFHAAEKDHNPRCRTYLDALVFVTTSLSVGYDNKFAQTEAGKAIASFVQTFGPSLAASALDSPTAAEEQRATEQAMLDRLDAILEELRRSRGAAGG